MAGRAAARSRQLVIRRMDGLRVNLPSVAPHRRAGKPCIVRHAVFEGVRWGTLAVAVPAARLRSSQPALAGRTLVAPECQALPPAGGPFETAGVRLV